MTYYDELGLPRTASTQEIRRAYRTLVRLLHPDRQPDEQLRRAAERQLQRISAIVAVLTDDQLRRQYDRDLAAQERRRPGPGVRLLTAARTLRYLDLAPTRGTWVWLGAAACGILGMVFLLRDQAAPTRALAPVAPAQVAAAPPPAPEPPRPRSQPARPRPLEPPPLRPPSGPIADPPPAISPAAPPVAPATPFASLVKTPAPPPPAPRTLSGRWVFTRGHYAPEKGLFAPEYIELALEQESNQVRGNYRARYIVDSQPVSPNVVFAFQGPSQPDRARLPWTSPGGARGEIQLTLQPDGTLFVNWWATRLGSKAELTSGTAVLLRLGRD